MSIIEKAASRLEHTRRRPAPAASAVGSATPAAAAAMASATALDMAAATASASAAAVAPQPRARPAPAQREATVLDLGRMQEMGLITEAGGRTALVEDFRNIKRPVLKRAFAAPPLSAHPGNLVMISSALPGEGKTYCSVNLALSIAMELDHTVLLVDADVAKPAVLKTLGLAPQRGLMDLLLNDQLDLADVLLRTSIDTLSILAAGSPHPRSTELLASQAMQALVLEIAQRYPDRIVIFDSPPLLLTSESSVLAGHMGQIVMVVESEQTTQHAVLEALRRLEGCDHVSLIYNKSRDFASTGTYGYYYA